MEKIIMNLNNFLPHLINVLLGVTGFFLVNAYNRTNEQLAQINRDVLIMNKDLVSLNLKMTEINSKMMTDDRVREIVRLELMNK